MKLEPKEFKEVAWYHLFVKVSGRPGFETSVEIYFILQTDNL